MTTVDDPFLPSSGPRIDEAILVVNTFIAALLDAFNPADSIQPPLGGGGAAVHFLSGEVVALELFDAQAIGSNCSDPFLWVRAVDRFRWRDFPAPYTGALAGDCEYPSAMTVEMGIARCTSLDASGSTINWAKIGEEARIGLDDSWRIQLALCAAVPQLHKQSRLVAIRPVIPQGPAAGVQAWATVTTVSLSL